MRNLPSNSTLNRMLHRPGRSLIVAFLLAGGAIGVQESSTILAADGPDRVVVSQALTTGGLQSAERSPAVVVNPPPTTPSVTASFAEMSREVAAITNAQRAKAGLAPLIYSVELEQAALAHAVDQRNAPCQAGSLTHTGSDGSNAADRIARTGLRISRWAENIACAFRTAPQVMGGWMNSPGHAANIMDSRLTHIGVAIAESNTGQLYWVQEFAVPRA